MLAHRADEDHEDLNARIELQGRFEAAEGQAEERTREARTANDKLKAIQTELAQAKATGRRRAPEPPRSADESLDGIASRADSSVKGEL